MPTFKNYLIGFISSIILTITAFALVEIHVASRHRTLSHPLLIGVILTLAMGQLVIQLCYFLHLGDKSKRWNLTFFISTLGIILLVVVGSLWIMYALNFNMTPQQVNQYLQDQGSY